MWHTLVQCTHSKRETCQEADLHTLREGVWLARKVMQHKPLARHIKEVKFKTVARLFGVQSSNEKLLLFSGLGSQ
jgi:hypothetical protein